MASFFKIVKLNLVGSNVYIRQHGEICEFSSKMYINFYLTISKISESLVTQPSVSYIKPLLIIVPIIYLFNNHF